jgi:transcription initiation factor IIF auxiliary subunit
MKFDNYAKMVGKKGEYNWYRWKIFVDEDDEVLDKIESVEYLLHETFPNPNRIIENRDSKFALETAGWGEFTIFITVRFKDGREEEFTYWLDLSKGWS